MNLEIDYIYSQITEKGEEPSVITNEKHDALQFFFFIYQENILAMSEFRNTNQIRTESESLGLMNAIFKK